MRAAMSDFRMADCETPGEMFKDLIPRQMAVGIVDLLEFVEVKGNHGQGVP